MSDENKVLQFPTGEQLAPEAPQEEQDFLKDADGNFLLNADGERIPALKKHQIDPNDPLNKATEQQMQKLMKQMGEMVGMLEAQWKSTESEFKLQDSQMKAVYAWNEENRDHPPEGASNEELQEMNYDRFNGIDRIPEELCAELFPKGNDGYDHPIIGITHDVTKDRIKSALNDFFSWMGAIKEYRQIHDAYMELIEFQEVEKIKELERIAETEEDPEKKAGLLNAVSTYYRNKYLDFLQDELDEKTMKRLIETFSNQNKVAYWIDRSRRKLEQMKLSPKFILEISQFEKRFLPEKYHDQNNIFLLYFLGILAYTDAYDKKNKDRTKVVCIVFGLDRFIRNQWSGEIRERILQNMIIFQEQFMGKLPKPKKEEEIEEELPADNS